MYIYILCIYMFKISCCGLWIYFGHDCHDQSTIKNKRTQTPCILKIHGFLQGFDHDLISSRRLVPDLRVSKILPTGPPGRYQKDVSLTVSVLGPSSQGPMWAKSLIVDWA